MRAWEGKRKVKWTIIARISNEGQQENKASVSISKQKEKVFMNNCVERKDFYIQFPFQQKCIKEKNTTSSSRNKTQKVFFLCSSKKKGNSFENKSCLEEIKA